MRLTAAFVRHRLSQLTALVLLGFVLGAAVVGLATVRNSAVQAILQSAHGDVGHRSYALQTGSADLSDTLRGRTDIAPVQDEPGDVIAGDFSAPVLVRAITDPALELGVVTQGVRPQRSGEVLLSEHIAQAFGVVVGDTVQLRVNDEEKPVRVVGFCVDPADKTTSTVVALVGDSSEFRPTIWLSESNFYRTSGLKPLLDQHRSTSTYTSVESLLDGARENQPRFLSAMQFVPAGSGLLLAVVIVAAGGVFASRWRSDADTLIATGMAPVNAWRRILSIVFGSVLTGQLLGGAAVIVALWIGRVEVSSWVGQRWVSIAVPWQAALLMLALTALSMLVSVPLVRLARGWAGRLAPRPATRRWPTYVATLVAGAGLAAWLILLRVSLRPDADFASVLAPLAAVLVTAAIPFVIAPVLCLGLARTTRALMRHLVAALRPVAAVAAVVALSCGMWAAQTTSEANSGEAASSPLEPAGSFAISAMPDAAIPTLLEVYRAHGGVNLLQFAIPAEPTTRLRATGPKTIACMRERGTTNPVELPSTCFAQRTSAPLNMVQLGPPGSVPRADARLVENGKVGLMVFSGGERHATRLADASAAPDPLLGGNLPGLVVPEDGEVAKTYGLKPGGTSSLTLLDFSELDREKQFLIRTTVLRLAPSAQTANGSDPTAYDRLRSVANTVSFIGAAAAAVIVLLGGIALVVAHRLTRRTLVDLGARPGPRWGIVARWAAVPAVSIAVTVPLAILTVSSGGQNTAFSFGTLWILPGVLGTAASLVIGVAFLRPPQRATD